MSETLKRTIYGALATVIIALAGFFLTLLLSSYVTKAEYLVHKGNFKVIEAKLEHLERGQAEIKELLE